MKLGHFVGLFALVLAFVTMGSANAADRSVFSGKSQNQHELTDWEQNKLKAEFDSKFSVKDSGAFQKLNNNPWAAKRDKENQHNQRMLQLSNSWSACREYAYKQRGQCYARGGDAYTCERYYDARVGHCDDRF
jgi:hypothetical protein